MAKSKKKTVQTERPNQKSEPAAELDASSEYHLPIESQSKHAITGGKQTLRLMVLLALALGACAAFIVWWLGNRI